MSNMSYRCERHPPTTVHHVWFTECNCTGKANPPFSEDIVILIVVPTEFRRVSSTLTPLSGRQSRTKLRSNPTSSTVPVRALDNDEHANPRAETERTDNQNGNRGKGL
jgi:hypothetical protein